MRPRPRYYWSVRIAVALCTLLAWGVSLAAVRSSAVEAAEAERAAAEKATRHQLIAGCRATNNVRRVVFKNTQNAVAQSKRIGDPPSILGTFQRNLVLLTSGPFVTDHGTRRCQKAFR